MCRIQLQQQLKDPAIKLFFVVGEWALNFFRVRRDLSGIGLKHAKQDCSNPAKLPGLRIELSCRLGLSALSQKFAYDLGPKQGES